MYILQENITFILQTVEMQIQCIIQYQYILQYVIQISA